jgi:hypothetical protein
MSGFETPAFKTSGLQNVSFTKRQNSKRLVSKRLISKIKSSILIKQKGIGIPKFVKHFACKLDILKG